MTINPQISPQTIARSPLGYSGPSAQDFADALLQLHKTAPSQIRTPAALGTNLLADALLQYGQERARQRANASLSPELNAPPSPASDGTAPGAPDGAPGVSPPSRLAPLTSPFLRSLGYGRTEATPDNTLMPGYAPLRPTNADFDQYWAGQ
jgi:hypothetical protein